MIRGLISCRRGQSKPSRANVPGAMFSMTTSACSSICVKSALPASVLRLQVTARLLRLVIDEVCRIDARHVSEAPAAGLAPLWLFDLHHVGPEPSECFVQDGPASNCVRSTTFMPFSAAGMSVVIMSFMAGLPIGIQARCNRCSQSI